MNNQDRPASPMTSTDSLARTMRKEGVEDTIKAIGGLTKLEHAAIQNMSSIMGDPNSCDASYKDIAISAVSGAKALFAELEKDNG